MDKITNGSNRRNRTLALFLRVRNSRFGDFVGGITGPSATYAFTELTDGEEEDVREEPALDRGAQALPPFRCPRPDGPGIGAESEEARRPRQYEAGTLEAAPARVHRGA